MADTIQTVVGDELPAIQLALTNEASGIALDLSASSTVITVKFRLAGTTTTLSTITCTKPGGGSDGIVQFDFTGGVLDVTAGAYEGDILISYNGDIHTVFDTLRFRVRVAAS